MIINKVNIISFAGIKNKLIEFNEGINLIYGENEKGKSTIQSFIRVWLYGMNQKRSKDIRNNDRVRFMPIDGEKIRGELYITYNNRKYIIKRSFGVTKKDDTSEILDAESGEAVLDINKEEPGKYFLNVNYSTFYKTLFINQLGVTISKDKEEEIIDRASNILNEDDENISIQKALERLESIKKSITTVRKNGELDILKDKLSLLNQEKYEAYNLSEKSLDNEKKLLYLKDKRNEVRNEISNLDIYKKYLKRVKLQREYEEITEYLKKKEELKKKERYIEESIDTKFGHLNINLLNDIKEENSLFFSILDMCAEEEKELKRKREEYLDKKSEFKELNFLESISNEDKNKFIRVSMENEILEEKIKRFNEIERDINIIKRELKEKEKFIGSSINFKDVREEVGELLNKYEDKLKEIKFRAETYGDREVKLTKIKNIFKCLIVFNLIATLSLVFIFTFFTKQILVQVIFISLILFVFYNIISLKFKINSLEKELSSIKILDEEIKNIEKQIFKYTKLIQAKSYEDFIRKLRLYDEFSLYKERQNIKIKEKEEQININEIAIIKQKYMNNDRYINYIYDLAETDNKELVIDMFNKYDEFNKLLLSLKVEINKDEKSILKTKDELKMREERLRDKLEEIGLKNIDLYELEEKLLEIKEKVMQREEIIRSLKNIDETYNALTKDKDIEAIKEELKDIINQDLNYSYSSEEEIDNQVFLKSNELIEIEKDIKDVENILSNRFIGKRSIPEIEEEIDSTKEKISKLESLLRATEIAITNMNEAIREIRGNFGSILNSSVRDYFRELTNNAYEEVLVSESYDMKIRQNNELLQGGMLSNGANDQLYLALRLSFIKMIYKEKDYPLILDDAFVQYDDKRLKNALDLLYKLNFKQLIIFTCQSREEKAFINKNISFNYINL